MPPMPVSPEMAAPVPPAKSARICGQFGLAPGEVRRRGGELVEKAEARGPLVMEERAGLARKSLFHPLHDHGGSDVRQCLYFFTKLFICKRQFLCQPFDITICDAPFACSLDTSLNSPSR